MSTTYPPPQNEVWFVGPVWDEKIFTPFQKSGWKPHIVNTMSELRNSILIAMDRHTYPKLVLNNGPFSEQEDDDLRNMLNAIKLMCDVTEDTIFVAPLSKDNYTSIHIQQEISHAGLQHEIPAEINLYLDQARVEAGLESRMPGRTK